MATTTVTTRDTFAHCTGEREGQGRERKVAKSAWRKDIFNPDNPDPKYRELVGKRRALAEELAKLTREIEDFACARMVAADVLPKRGWRHASDTDRDADIEVLFGHRFGLMSSVAIVPVDKTSTRKSNVGGSFAC